jgi:hypothetical protein
VSVTTVLLLVIVALTTGCGGSSEEIGADSGGPPTDSLEGLTFEVEFPAYRPAGVGDYPEIIRSGRDEITLRYLPEASDQGPGLMLQVVQSTGLYTSPMDAFPPLSHKSVSGVPVTLQRSDLGDSSLVTGFFAHGGISFVVMIEWETQSRWTEASAETELMGVIDSLVSSG